MATYGIIRVEPGNSWDEVFVRAASAREEFERVARMYSRHLVWDEYSYGLILCREPVIMDGFIVDWEKSLNGKTYRAADMDARERMLDEFFEEED